MAKNLTTESRNPASEAIDSLSALEITRLINSQDARIAQAVSLEETPIARAIEVITERLSGGGRLIYIGAGTSGRLGVLDAAECPPTFNAPPEQVVGLIAGGRSAMFRAVEGAEDSLQLAVDDLKEIDLSPSDAVVGIATSGRTPYVIGGMRFAQSQGIFTIGLSCNRDSELAACADLVIAPVVGPEVISGSTRMKAGTATKMVLNMLTTGAMVRLGKTYGNLMVDLRASNSKLVARSRRIVSMLTDLSETEAEQLLARCNGELKTAVVVNLKSVTTPEARRLLADAAGHLRRALKDNEK